MPKKLRLEHLTLPIVRRANKIMLASVIVHAMLDSMELDLSVGLTLLLVGLAAEWEQQLTQAHVLQLLLIK